MAQSSSAAEAKSHLAKYLRAIEQGGRVIITRHGRPVVALVDGVASVPRSAPRRGQRLADAGLQIAATALQHDLELVAGNLRRFERIPNLRLNRRLIES